MAMTSRRELLLIVYADQVGRSKHFCVDKREKHILSGILALCPHVRILSPEDVMHQFRDELKRMMEGYDE